MPCSDGREPYYRSNPAMERQCRSATRAACDMRTILRRHGLLEECCRETRQWVQQHDREDAARIKRKEEQKWRENARLKAMEKLSLEERRILGL